MNAEELKYYTLPKMQEFFREMMGEWQEGDWYSFDISAAMLVDCTNVQDLNERSDIRYDTILRLPLPIDPGDTERLARGEKARGLWGMVDWKDTELLTTSAGLLSIWGRRFPSIETPTLALLKALAHQQGIDI